MNNLTIFYEFRYFILLFVLLSFKTLSFSQPNSHIIPVCYSAVQISLDASGQAEINKDMLDEGSYSVDGKALYFKVLRANNSLQYDGGCIDLNGDDDLSTPEIDVWFDDNAVYCCNDFRKEDYAILRVFDEDPGDGAVNPHRMLPGGDLYKHYSQCATSITAINKVPPVISCKDVKINCNDSLDPNSNPEIYPQISSVCDYTLDFDTQDWVVVEQILKESIH